MDKYLVVGLGSMGKRRVRCLLALGVSPNKIYGLDLRADRRQEAKERYGINVVTNESEVPFDDVKAVIVSLPPDKHFIGADIAIRNNKPVFIEASVVLEDVIKIKETNNGNVFIAPSCTLAFNPMIRKINEIIKQGKYGKVTNFSYHSGQYLPDWHPWEDVNDFYVSNKITGGGREIVPFELSWIVQVLGFPKDIKGYYRKTMDVGCDIDDSYVCTIDYGTSIGTMVVDVASRFATRNLIINMEKGQIQYRWDKKQVELYDATTMTWEYFEEEKSAHEDGYNENINELMYVDEISAFLSGIENSDNYPNTIDMDIKVLELLEKIEKSDDRV